MTERFDVVVVGAGAMGTAAARQLALRGRRTLLLERHEVGHDHGSSGGPTRIFRYVYDVPRYVRMAVLARAAWDELQDAAGEELLRVTGGLDLDRGPAVREVLAAEGVDVEVLTPRAVRERWPSLRLPEGTEVLHQPGGGVVRAAATVAAQARLASEAGAVTMTGAAVRSVRPSSGGVSVIVEDGERFEADVAVVAAGSWAGPLLADAGIDVPLVPTQEQVSYFAVEEPSPLPTVIDWAAGPSHVYLVPDPWAPGELKVGLHRSGPPIDPDAAHLPPDPERLERVRDYLRERLAPHRELGRVDTCRYTNTPDEDFVLDRVGPIVVASPCSGHGFKFVPLMGVTIAALATGEALPLPLEPFRADRPALRPAP